MDGDPVIDYYSETFASMSFAYAAAHAEEPAEPGPTYEPSIAITTNHLTAEEEAVLQLSQEEFEAHICEKTLAIIKAEATEVYVPEETDGANPYSAINFGSVWRMVEMDSIDFYHNGEAIGESRLVPIVNAEDAILSEGGKRSLNQEAMNQLVAERMATPPGGYERAFKMNASLTHLIRVYVDAHPEGPKEEHYRELIDGVKMGAAEELAAEARAKQKEDIEERLRELGLDNSILELVSASE